jgi:transcriptional regulator with XRE-family HTH domain
MLSGDKLRFIRIYHNISQKYLADCIGKSDRWVRKIESGEEIPTYEVYVNWLNACYGRLKPVKKEKSQPTKMSDKKKPVTTKKK